MKKDLTGSDSETFPVLTGHNLLDGGQGDVVVSEEHRIGIVLNKGERESR